MDRQRSAAWWNLSKFAWCMLAICLMPLGIMLIGSSPVKPLPLVSFLAGAVLSLVVATFATRRARRYGSTFFDPYGTGVDARKYSFSLQKEKTLNFVPLRILVVAIVLSAFFGLGFAIGTWTQSATLRSIPDPVHWLLAISLAAFLGGAETKLIWAEFVDFGTYRGVPGPASLGFASGYLIATTTQLIVP